MLIHSWQVAQTSPDAVHIVDMPALDKEFGSNGKIVLLGINHDASILPARTFVAANHLDHWVMASAGRCCKDCQTNTDISPAARC